MGALLAAGALDLTATADSVAPLKRKLSMSPGNSLDPIVLIAAMLSSKRRPARLVEIVAAADLLQGFVPSAQRLEESMLRLFSLGLIGELEEELVLLPAGEALLAQQRKNLSNEELIAQTANLLATYQAGGEFAAPRLDKPRLTAAVREHKLARKSTIPNLLMPKAKPDRHFKEAGRWRRAPAKH